jgi:biotin-(acetyl-CoA carboxylase) ligase
VAVCEGARALGADVEIKWPNDVIAARGKVAGVLGEIRDGYRALRSSDSA